MPPMRPTQKGRRREPTGGGLEPRVGNLTQGLLKHYPKPALARTQVTSTPTHTDPRGHTLTHNEGHSDTPHINKHLKVTHANNLTIGDSVAGKTVAHGAPGQAFQGPASSRLPLWCVCAQGGTLSPASHSTAHALPRSQRASLQAPLFPQQEETRERQKPKQGRKKQPERLRGRPRRR